MDALVSGAQWVVSKALAPVADGVLEAWEASKNLGLNIDALRTELLLVQATLETASRKQIAGHAMDEILWKLRFLAHCAEDVLDELDYFRIHDELHSTYDAADHHTKGTIHDIALNAHHTAKAVAKLLGSSMCWSASSPAEPIQVEDARQRPSCCAWPRARQRSRGNSSSSSSPNPNQTDEGVNGCIPKIGKLLPCSYSPQVHDNKHVEETPMLGFNRVNISQRMKHIVEQLQPLRREFTTILQSCGQNTVPHITHSRPITTSRSIEPKLYGRDLMVKSIIHDITKGEYHGKDLTVLPIVGPGGIGKTTMIQHIYQDKQVQKHFQVLIWVCVSVNFNLNKLLEDINRDISPVEGEKGYRPEELIEQRLKSKRFLLVLDDIWKCDNEDDWERLLLPLKTSQEKGNMILVTTRFPSIAKMVGTTGHSIALDGLESKYFRELFHAFVFGDDECRRDHIFLLEVGDQIMAKLKGSPLAAKTVGRLLRKDLSLRHWIRVLESKEWEKQSGSNDIMPALKLSYDYLPFHLQQCFSYAALFPEDFDFSSSEVTNLWIGLDILQHGARNQTFQDIGLSNLNDLVTHGFFKEEKTYGRPSYVMHDLLRDLALQVASQDCVSLHHSNIGLVEIKPSIRHLSIIIDDVGADFKSELRKLQKRLKVEHLQTLMLFGQIDESFANIFGDLFRKAKSLRVLHLLEMACPVESIIHNFSTLVHLRYLCLGTEYGKEMHLPLAISRFYHLRILDLQLWSIKCFDFPKDLSNLAKLHLFYTPTDELHSDIVNVGKHKLLEELKEFRVNKGSEGFEPKQLEHLNELRVLGIYNLENIRTKEEAAKAKLIEKKYLKRLTLVWDSERSNTETDLEEVVLESLQPHRYLQELCIRGHRGPFGPAWLIDTEALQSLHLVDVSWQCLPSLGKTWDLHTLILWDVAAMKEFVIEQSFGRLVRLELVRLGSFEKWVPSNAAHHMFPVLQVLIISDCPNLLEFPFSNSIVYHKPDQILNIDWFPKLQELRIENCLEFMLVPQIPWTETLHSVTISHVKLLQYLDYNLESSRLSITAKDELHNLDRVLAFSNLTGLEFLHVGKCPALEWKHLMMLISLKALTAESLDGLVAPLGGQGYVEWQHPVEHLVVPESCGSSGKDLTELLTHLPRLSKLEIRGCKNIKQLAVGVDLQQTTSAAIPEVAQEKEEDGLLLFPTHLSNTLCELAITDCRELVLVEPLSTYGPVTGGGGFHALRSLQKLEISVCPNMISSKSLISSPSFCLFPSSLQDLCLCFAGGIGSLEPLSNLNSLTKLELSYFGEELKCKALEPFLSAEGQLRELTVFGSPRFFVGWDPNPRLVLQNGGEEKELQHLVSHLWTLSTDEAMGFLVAPICSFLSSSLAWLCFEWDNEMEHFTEKQEDALHLLTSLQQLEFKEFYKLQSLPAGLHKLTNLKLLRVWSCPAIRSLPKDGFPKSLQVLDVTCCDNKELNEQCKG